MTQESIVRERYARWVNELFNHGYIVKGHSRASTIPGAGLVKLRARRRELLGEPIVLIEIAEAWINKVEVICAEGQLAGEDRR